MHLTWKDIRKPARKTTMGYLSNYIIYLFYSNSEAKKI
jgi:hypothetical protein